jgi:hypothetical protein
MAQISSDEPERKHTNDTDSEDEFHDARFPAEEEAVRSPSPVLSLLCWYLLVDLAN